MVFVAFGPAPPVHANMRGTKLLCSTSLIGCSYLSFFETFVVAVGVFQGFRAGFCVRIEYLDVEKGSCESGSRESVRFDV